MRNSLLLAILLILAAEGLARVALAPIGGYWRYWNRDAAIKFEAYESLIESRTIPDTLIVGDSTGALNIDPVSLAPPGSGEEALVYNLAHAANFADAFRLCTMPLLKYGPAPETVIVSFSPHAFMESAAIRQMEHSIISSPYCRELQGEPTLADYVFLARIRSAMPFRQSWFTGNDLSQPDFRGFTPRNLPFREVQAAYAAGAFVPERFQAIENLADLGESRGFRVVVVLPPRIDASVNRISAGRKYRALLKEEGLAVLDYRDASFLKHDKHFSDKNHLNALGARLFSRRLERDLRILESHAPASLDADGSN